MAILSSLAAASLILPLIVHFDRAIPRDKDCPDEKASRSSTARSFITGQRKR
ncbi:hypothetical protein L484_017971 [Morus notabilis]|uniref:Uncharacterized protein n=1 Tax=Morus notabilis TaxID=981085 RepID=W9RA63_9ROSA|nr:hypothetical protein L484_017971 [Morus notabilis]